MRDRLCDIEKRREAQHDRVRAWTDWVEHHCDSCPLERDNGGESDGHATTVNTGGRRSVLWSDPYATRGRNTSDGPYSPENVAHRIALVLMVPVSHDSYMFRPAAGRHNDRSCNGVDMVPPSPRRT